MRAPFGYGSADGFRYFQTWLLDLGRKACAGRNPPEGYP